MTLPKVVLLVGFVVLAGCTTVVVDNAENRRQLAAEVVDAADVVHQREELREDAVAALSGIGAGGAAVSPARARLRELMARTNAAREKVLTPERLRGIYIDAYASTFTAGELSKLRDLYRSEGGKVFVQKQVQLQRAVTTATKAATLELQPEIRRIASDEAQRLLLDRKTPAVDRPQGERPANETPAAPASAEAHALQQRLYPDAQSRFDRANRLARDGKSEEALKEYLWCYDDGMRGTPAFTGVRGSFLLKAISDLGEKYPPALQALRDRRDAARLQLNTSPEDYLAATDFVTLNRTLADPGANLDLYDALPPASRGRLGVLMFEQLVDAKRYKEAVAARPYSQYIHTFEVALSAVQNQPSAKIGTRAILKQAIVEIEALAGAGDVDHARQLIDRVLAVDGGEPVKDSLRRHLDVAGHPELMPK